MKTGTLLIVGVIGAILWMRHQGRQSAGVVSTPQGAPTAPALPALAPPDMASGSDMPVRAEPPPTNGPAAVAMYSRPERVSIDSVDESDPLIFW